MSTESIEMALEPKFQDGGPGYDGGTPLVVAQNDQVTPG